MISRRQVIATLFAGATSVYAQDHAGNLAKPYGWAEDFIDGRKVYIRGEGRNIVILLHEINGLSPGCIDFGVELAANGFKVYLPLLFGHAMQNAFIPGAIESCWFGGFKCYSPGGKEDTKPVLWVRGFVRHLCDRADTGAVGVIGMCETGAFPLATMQKDTKVKAVVLSQPALPFSKENQRNVGLTQATMERARQSLIPILAFRFTEDTISSGDRFQFLSEYFGPRQFEGHQLDCPGFHQTLTHRLHAVLTGPFGEIRENARRRTIQFLEHHLKQPNSQS